ncbi:hypothetical protein [Anaerobacillus alkaliphilus]|uniref:hypothetical protein n=1 Tax=Anaerobacillus alkaliphilus TaxID=1548597 RepID=UPI00100AF8EE|nr:hypothetical protein [Anaerobacillus alkaliphilus]
MKVLLKGLLIVVFFVIYFWYFSLITGLIEFLMGGFATIYLLIISSIMVVVSVVLSMWTTNKVLETIKANL